MRTLRKRMTEDLRIRNYSPRTVRTYVWHVAKFAKQFAKPPGQLGAEEVRAFQLRLIESKTSGSSFNQAVCALKFFYTVTLPRDFAVEHIAFAKSKRPLPTRRRCRHLARLPPDRGSLSFIVGRTASHLLPAVFRAMKLRILALLALAGIAAFLPNSPPDLRLLPAKVVYIVAPAVLGIVVAILCRSWSWQRSMLALASCILIAQALRVAPMVLRFALEPVDDEPLRAPDEPLSKGLFLLAVALAFQAASAATTFLPTRALLRWAAQQGHAAGPKRPAADGQRR